MLGAPPPHAPARRRVQSMSFIIHAGLPGTLRGTKAGAAAPGRRGPAFGASLGGGPTAPPHRPHPCLLFHTGPIPKALPERDVSLSIPCMLPAWVSYHRPHMGSGCMC